MKTTTLLLGLLIVLLGFNANAHIVYTDINPDGLPTGEGFDFNGDGTNELNCTSPFYITFPAGSDIWAFGLPPGQGSDWDVTKPLAVNTVIDTNGNFLCKPSHGGDCNMNGVTTNPFANMVNQDKFIGVKMRFNGHGQPHYGWIRVVWDGTTFTFKDFAYETTPNKAIKAGEKTTGIESKKQEISFLIFPNPATTNITIENKSNTLITNLKVYTVLGKEIKTIKIQDSSKIILDVSELPKGIYFIQLINIEGVILTKRIIIDK